MRKVIILSGIIIAIVVFAIVGFMFYTKSFSPKGVTAFNEEENEITVTYSRPFKREREIFGELVPFDKVWRTGANEATVFKTLKDIKIDDSVLPSGSYSIFTIPGEESWKVIFNKETGQWGINPFSGLANRDPEQDVLEIEVHAIQTQDTFEQFTINFDHVGNEIDMVLMWDQTLVVVPINSM